MWCNECSIMPAVTLISAEHRQRLPSVAVGMGNGSPQAHGLEVVTMTLFGGGPEIFRRRNPAGGSRPLGAWAFFYSCCFLSCCLLPGQLRCEWLTLQPCLSQRNGLKLPETMNQTLLWVVSVRYWVTAMREMTYTLSMEAITGFSFLKFWFCHEFKGHFFFFYFSSPKGFYC